MYISVAKNAYLCYFRISLSKAAGSDAITGNLDSERQTELDIKCLQILRASIYNKIILIDEEDKDRNPKKYRKYVKTYINLVHCMQYNN